MTNEKTISQKLTNLPTSHYEIVVIFFIEMAHQSSPDEEQNYLGFLRINWRIEKRAEKGCLGRKR